MRKLKSSEVFIDLKYGIEYRIWTGTYAASRKVGTTKWEKSFITNKELGLFVNAKLLIEKQQLASAMGVNNEAQ